MYHLFRENILLCQNIRHHCIERQIRSLEEHERREEKRRTRAEKFEILETMDENCLEMMSKYDEVKTGGQSLNDKNKYKHIWCCSWKIFGTYNCHLIKVYRVQSLSERKLIDVIREERDNRLAYSANTPQSRIKEKPRDLIYGFSTSWINVWNFICCLIITLNVRYRFLKVLAPIILKFVTCTDFTVVELRKSESYSFLDFVRNSKMMI